jgi:hypothetical protein
VGGFGRGLFDFSLTKERETKMEGRKKNQRRIASMDITFTMLEKLLRLPEGHHIVEVLEERGRLVDTFRVLIEGPKMPVAQEGGSFLSVVGKIEDGGEMEFLVY